MPRPWTRLADRNSSLVRQWKLLVLLRRGPRTLKELANLLGCHQRTVRRDLYALQAAGLPVASKFAANEGVEPCPLLGRPYDGHGNPVANIWGIGAMPEWPRNDELPTTELGL